MGNLLSTYRRLVLRWEKYQQDRAEAPYKQASAMLETQIGSYQKMREKLVVQMRAVATAQVPDRAVLRTLAHQHQQATRMYDTLTKRLDMVTRSRQQVSALAAAQQAVAAVQHLARNSGVDTQDLEIAAEEAEETLRGMQISLDAMTIGADTATGTAEFDVDAYVSLVTERPVVSAEFPLVGAGALPEMTEMGDMERRRLLEED